MNNGFMLKKFNNKKMTMFAEQYVKIGHTGASNPNTGTLMLCICVGSINPPFILVESSNIKRDSYLCLNLSPVIRYKITSKTLDVILGITDNILLKMVMILALRGRLNCNLLK
jgi:hypothetical protein